MFRCFLTCALLALLAVEGLSGRARFAAFGEVRDILSTLDDILPPSLKDGAAATERTWAAWIAAHDREIRSRLARGDQDTIVNWIQFGTSFTSKPRVLPNPPGAASAADAARLIAGRIHDLAVALAAPGQDERRLFARKLLEGKGFRLDGPDGLARLEQHLAQEVERVAGEQAAYSRELDAVRQLPDTTEQFARRSRLYRERGLSLDTSLAPGFALEHTLRRLLSDGVVAGGAVRRVAVIGPGLDFADKAAGIDVYPQQTLQPFALSDTLVRLGLSGPGGPEIVTLDISPRVNDHLARARTRARAGAPYVLRLPLDRRVHWEPGLIEYWKQLGDRIGDTRPAKPPAAAEGFDVRTIAVRPSVALRIAPEDLDIVVQRYEGPPFDLVVATNVFVYYDTLDQSLALSGVEAMLRPGGVLLTNNALLELPVSRMRSAGYLTVQYSDRPEDGDHIVWYRRLP